MKLDGLDELLNELHDELNDIDDDIDDILLNQAREFLIQARMKARKVMNKDYWTGNLSRELDYEKTGDLEYTVLSNAHYSGYLEFGTRYMEAAPFMWPTYLVIQKSTVKEISELLNG